MSAVTEVELGGRPVVITGAARGLGAAYARECARRGAALVLTDIARDDLDMFAQSLRADGAVVHTVAGDVVDPEFADHVATECEEHVGRVAGWVNNAGVEVLQPVDSTDAAAVRRMVSVNLLGTIYGTAAAARSMPPGGSIVNVTSGAQFGLRHLSVYGATKGGIASYTFAAALELEDRGIRVNAVSPLAHTSMSEAGDAYFTALTGREVAGAAGLNLPDACAGLVSCMLSDAARGITGQVLRFDGVTLSVVRRSEVVSEGAVSRPEWSAEEIAEALQGPLAARMQAEAFRSPGLPVDDPPTALPIAPGEHGHTAPRGRRM